MAPFLYMHGSWTENQELRYIRYCEVSAYVSECRASRRQIRPSDVSWRGFPEAGRVFASGLEELELRNLRLLDDSIESHGQDRL